MRFAALIVLGACSFQPRAAAPSGGDGGGGRGEAGPVIVDALPIDGPPDAPPDACSDGDNDGVCDTVDDWPCGAKPAAPGTTVTMMTNGTATDIVLTQIAVNGSQMIVVAPGASLDVTYHYTATDTACPTACVDQIEIGFSPGHRVGCEFDRTVPKQGGVSGTVADTVDAPAARGEYDLRTNIGQGNSCGTQTAWWANVPPDDTRTLARVCVH